MNSRIQSRSPTPSPRPAHHSHHGRKVAYAAHVVKCVSFISNIAAPVFPPAQAVSYPVSVFSATLNLFQKASGNSDEYENGIEKAQACISAFGDLCQVASVGIPVTSIGSTIAWIANAGLWIYKKYKNV